MRTQQTHRQEKDETPHSKLQTIGRFQSNGTWTHVLPEIDIPEEILKDVMETLSLRKDQTELRIPRCSERFDGLPAYMPKPPD